MGKGDRRRPATVPTPAVDAAFERAALATPTARPCKKCGGKSLVFDGKITRCKSCKEIQ